MYFQYLFNKEEPPIIPACNLIYYDETKETVPYLFSVNEYIRGKPLFQVINRYISEGKNLYAKKFLNLFSNLGELLGRLHMIEFQSYYRNISDIGKSPKISYSEYLESELWDSIKQRLWKKGKRACQSCGNKNIVYHHLKYNYPVLKGKSNALKWIIPLCNNCHYVNHKPEISSNNESAVICKMDLQNQQHLEFICI